MAERFGPYEIEAPLGRGGMGEVHRAVDLRKGRSVALKRLPAELTGDATLEERFRREAEVAARLTEPHVIPIHDYGQIDGRLFLDMRLVEGVTVAQLLRDGPMDPRRAVAVLDQVATALDAAHDAGLVHRDVKPSNVLLTTPHPDSPAQDFAYLIDFGIAAGAVGGDRLTSPGSTMGTAAYMAPERFTGGDDDRRGDVYALGCLLVEMLTGAPPFHGETLASLMWQHVHAAPPSVSGRVALPPAFDPVVAAALAKDPAARPARAGHVADAARRALAPPPPAPSPSTPAGATPSSRVADGLRTAGHVTALVAASLWLLAALGTLAAVGATGPAQVGVAGVAGSMAASIAGLRGHRRWAVLAWGLLVVSFVAVVLTLVVDA